ncbi:cell division protein ZapA [Mesoaciditoga sp.]
MKRTVTFELGSRKYKFTTTDPQQEVDETLSAIREEFENYAQIVDKHGYDKVFLMMLLNNVHENIVLKERIKELTKKLELTDSSDK